MKINVVFWKLPYLERWICKTVFFTAKKILCTRQTSKHQLFWKLEHKLCENICVSTVRLTPLWCTQCIWSFSPVHNHFSSTVCTLCPSAVFISKELTKFALQWSMTAAGDECMFEDNCWNMQYIRWPEERKCNNSQKQTVNNTPLLLIVSFNPPPSHTLSFITFKTKWGLFWQSEEPLPLMGNFQYILRKWLW